MNYKQMIDDAREKTSYADAAYVLQQQGILRMTYPSPVSNLGAATLIMGHSAKQVRTGQVTHNDANTGYAEFQQHRPGYYTAYEIPVNPTKRRPNLKMQQTTAGALKGAGEMLVDYDRCAVLVISSTYHIGVIEDRNRVYLRRDVAGISPEGLVRLANAGLWPEELFEMDDL